MRVFLKTLFIIYPKNDKENMVIKVCRRPTKQVFLKLSQNSQENTSAGVPSNKKFAGLQPATLLNKRLQHGCFPVHFTKLNNTFLTKHLRPTSPMPKFQPTPPTPFFFDPRQKFMDLRHPRQNLDPRHLRLFLTHANFYLTHATHATHAIQQTCHRYCSLQLPLYYLEQLHRLAIEN